MIKQLLTKVFSRGSLESAPKGLKAVRYIQSKQPAAGKPSLQQEDEAWRRFKAGEARNIMDACLQVANTDLQYRALELLLCERMKDEQSYPSRY